MPALDFTEIPVATSGSGRDTFELFARDVLDHLGFKILEGPDRGADGGRDLLVEELRTGVAGESRVKWLVSCKHKAHSGASVAPADEPDIQDRLNVHGCRAFMGFYSTVPSSGLALKLNGSASHFESLVFDPERIERNLLSSPEGLRLARRYFPKSVETWISTSKAPAKVFSEPIELKCDHCGKNLLMTDYTGIVTLWKPYSAESFAAEDRTEHVYFSCKGNCDDRLRAKFRHQKMIDTWEDISDLMIPTIYLRWVMGTFNQLQSGHRYSSQAFEKMKDLIVNIFPIICRHLSDEDKDRVTRLQRLPGFLGGLGG